MEGGEVAGGGAATTCTAGGLFGGGRRACQTDVAHNGLDVRLLYNQPPWVRTSLCEI